MNSTSRALAAMANRINILWRACPLLPVGLSIELLNLKRFVGHSKSPFCYIGWSAYTEGSRGPVLKEGLKRRNWELLNRASSEQSQDDRNMHHQHRLLQRNRSNAAALLLVHIIVRK